MAAPGADHARRRERPVALWAELDHHDGHCPEPGHSTVPLVPGFGWRRSLPLAFTLRRRPQTGHRPREWT